MVLKRFDPGSLFGGAEKSALRLAIALLGKGVEVMIAGARIEPHWRKRENIPAAGRHLHVERIDRPSVRFFGTLVYNYRLLRMILRNRRKLDLVHIHFASFEMITAVIARIIGGPPVICKIACSGRSGELHLASRRSFYPLFRFFTRRVDSWVAISPAIRDELLLAGVKRASIIEIPNGIDPESHYIPGRKEKRSARASLGIDDESIILLFTGRLSRQKNLDILLEAMEQVARPGLKLLIAGKGPERERLERIASKETLNGSVSFLGPVEDPEILYRAADIFVLPSREEGMSNSLLEAMSSGLKVIATDISGSCELIDDGISGLLVPPGDARSLGEKILEAASGRFDPGTAPRERILEKYSIGSVADRYIDLYNALTDRIAKGKDRTQRNDPAGRISPLFLINSYPPKTGGAERLVESLVTEFGRKGFKSTVITRWQKNTPLIKNDDHALILRVPVFGPRLLRSLTFRSTSFLLLLILSTRYTCVHAHSLDSPADTGAAACRLTGRRLFVTIHNTGKIDRLADSFNGPGRFEAILHSTSGIVSINNQIAQELLTAGVPPWKIISIPNGVDTSIFHPASPEKKNQMLTRMGILGRTIFIFTGNFHSQKGIEILLEGWKIFTSSIPGTSALLLMAGDGVLFGTMKRLAEELDLLESVRFLGNRPDVSSFLKIADIFVQPSRWEGLSIALLEAMACGLPVIVTPVGGAVEAVTEGENGLFAPVDNPGALADGMKTLFENGNMRKSFGREGMERVVRYYSIDRCALAHIDLFTAADAGSVNLHAGEKERLDGNDKKKDKRGGPPPHECDEQAAEQKIKILS
ncbi:MAG: glycosyltransferase family 4 protein [Candidatus Krumholzibacteriota bacterium]|nr:glycosyltransferase family 4 protein [Candidatus Krumholzibacteriota bacterium]